MLRADGDTGQYLLAPHFHASSGKVINPNPSSARVGVHNLHHFWTNVTLQAPVGCCVRLKPSPFNGGDIGGLYAQLGAIAPDGDAVWDGSFDPGSAQPIITTPSIAGGGYIAGTLNILTFVAGALSKVPTAQSIQVVVSAVETAKKASDLIGAAQAIEKGDVTAFVKHFYKMLSDPNQRTLIRLALEQLGIVVSEGVLEKLTLVISIFELGQMAFDEVSALVQGTWAGVVTFSATYPPVTQPPVTPLRPTSAPYVPPPTSYQPPPTAYVPPATSPPTQPPTPPPTSAPTNPPTTPTPGARPAAPSNLQYSHLPDLRITWQDNSPDEQGFRIYGFQAGYGANCHVSPNCTVVGTAGAGTTSYSVASAWRPDMACFEVTAYNSFGESPPAEAVCIYFEL